jgi:hypothetical protein
MAASQGIAALRSVGLCVFIGVVGACATPGRQEVSSPPEHSE